MDASWTGLSVTAVVFGGGLAGLSLHRLLPERHLTKETADAVRLGTGMLSVLASLVLGLLTATAKNTFDTTDQSIRSYATNLIILDEALRDYGDAASQARLLLRRYTKLLIDDNWPPDRDSPAVIEDRAAGELFEHVRDAIRTLQPADAGQRWLQEQALQIQNGLLQQRWLLIERAGATIPSVTLGILVAWVTLIFASFGFNAPPNATVVVALLICACALGGAIFLILEMDSPFDGVLKLSPTPMLHAYAHMQS